MQHYALPMHGKRDTLKTKLNGRAKYFTEQICDKITNAARDLSCLPVKACRTRA
jgi:hypothetical protein